MEKTVVKIVKPKPLLTIPFYMEYQKRILNDYKFENVLREIYAFYEPIPSPSPFIRFEDFSFDLDTINQNTGKLFYMKGLIAHYSTLEQYDLIPNAEEIEKLITMNGNHDINFILFIYGDLKSHIFRHCMVEVNDNVQYKIKKISKFSKNEQNKEEISKIVVDYEKLQEEKVLSYYSSNIFTIEGTQHLILFDISQDPATLPSFLKNVVQENIAALQSPLMIILLKDSIYHKLDTTHSIILTIEDIKQSDNILNFNRADMKDVVVDLKQMFNPQSIAENAVDLNINLMKWRMAPDVNVNEIKNSKYLLIGAGTLGCHVSRCLLGWGARKITFIDNGRVSYSNPVRQSLYTFKDSIEDNSKATLAAKKLKEIFPLVESEGYVSQIPLPGRKIVDKNAEEHYMSSVELLEKLIQDHDIIFLLTDSRESRWFPSVIARHFRKLVITAAIGFDSFLVMRHGILDDPWSDGLGCYFCNDIISPIDTSNNRTLDQQCTISRPGISSICSGIAAELAVSYLNKENSVGQFLPHSIRGNISDYNFQCLTHNSFSNCVACSRFIQEEYFKNRDEFLINVMNDPYYIEKICGVEKLLSEIHLDQVEDDF